MRRFEPFWKHLEGTAGSFIDAAGDKFRSIDKEQPNPRATGNLEWVDFVRSQWAPISREWHAFRDAGGRLPNMEWLVGESLGNSGTWQGGVLLAKGKPATLLARQFPVTLDTLSRIPTLRSALWSVITPGTLIPTHQGPNPGVLRFHLGVDCAENTALEVETDVVPYRNGETILFDDTVSHAAWNRSERERVTLFCDVLRPLPSPWRQLNVIGQDLLMATPRARAMYQSVDVWHIALNPHLTVRT